jgi:AcrR family transcriptional regulator
MTGTGSTDPRVLRSRQTVLAATVEVLSERGFEGATVEAVVARSGVAKTTIYRQWPNRRELLLAAIESVVPHADGADTGSLAGDAEAFVRDLVTVLETAPLAKIVPGLIAAAERDPEIANLLADFTAERRRPLREALRRAAGRGETAAEGWDPDVLAGLLLGPLFYRRLLSRQPLTEEFAVFVARTVLARTALR